MNDIIKDIGKLIDDCEYNQAVLLISDVEFKLKKLKEAVESGTREKWGHVCYGCGP